MIRNYILCISENLEISNIKNHTKLTMISEGTFENVQQYKKLCNIFFLLRTTPNAFNGELLLFKYLQMGRRDIWVGSVIISEQLFQL